MQIAKSKINAEGKITIPNEVRKRLDLRPGTEIVWELDEDGNMRVRVIRTHLNQDLSSFFEPPAIRTANGGEANNHQDFWLFYWKNFGPAQD